MNAKWLVIIIVIWLFGAFIGSTFEYQNTSGTAGSTYTAGNATFTNGSTQVTGGGTAWTASYNNALIKCNADGTWYKINSVNAGTQTITLYSVYTGTTVAGTAYTISASGGWAGTGSGGYSENPATTIDYLMNVSNAVQTVSILGVIPIPLPNGEYFKALFKVITLQFSFITESYMMVYWLVLLPLAIAGILCLALLMLGIVRGNITW